MVTLGHSVGGQFLGLLTNHALARAHVQIATSVGYWRWEHAPFRYLAWWFWRVHGPLMLALKGYIPTGGGWAGLPLPRGVYEEWRRWCLRPDHFGPDLRTYLSDNVFAEIRAPLLTVGFTDDPIATRAPSASSTSSFRTRARESRWYSPRGRRRRSASGTKASSPRAIATRLWRPVLDWIDAQARGARMSASHRGHAGRPHHALRPARARRGDADRAAGVADAATKAWSNISAPSCMPSSSSSRAPPRANARRARAAAPRLRAARHHGFAARLHARRQAPQRHPVARSHRHRLRPPHRARARRRLARRGARRDELQLSQDHAVAAQGGLRRRAARLRLAARHRDARQTARRAHRGRRRATKSRSSATAWAGWSRAPRSRTPPASRSRS